MVKTTKVKKKKVLQKAIKDRRIPIAADFLSKKDARDVQIYVEAVVKKFGKYIKAMAVGGSQKTGRGKKKTSDIDIPIIVDDTDVKRMTRPELKEKLFARMCEMGFPISKKIHPQPYLLTEFWEYVREGNPVIYNLVLRDSVILYDTGFLLPMQMLLKMGNIRPSKEAVDKHIKVANQLIKLTKETMLSKLVYNLEQAAVSSTQAILMEIGIRPPPPRETADLAEQHLMKERKIITKSDVETIRLAVKIYKDVEHKRRKDITAHEFEDLMKKVEAYVEKIDAALKKIREEKGERWLYELYEDADKKTSIKHDGMIDVKLPEKGEDATTLIEEGLGQR